MLIPFLEYAKLDLVSFMRYTGWPRKHSITSFLTTYVTFCDNKGCFCHTRVQNTWIAIWYNIFKYC